MMSAEFTQELNRKLTRYDGPYLQRNEITSKRDEAPFSLSTDEHQSPPPYQEPRKPVQNNIQIPQIQSQPVMLHKDTNWDYLSTASCIFRIMIIISLSVSAALMATLDWHELEKEREIEESKNLKNWKYFEFPKSVVRDGIKLAHDSVTKPYHDWLDKAQLCFILFGFIVVAIHILKIIMNILNYGDYEPSIYPSARCVNAIMNLIDHLLYFALGAFMVLIVIRGIMFITNTKFIVSIVFFGIYNTCKEILFFIECCCRPSVVVAQAAPQQIVVVQTH